MRYAVELHADTESGSVIVSVPDLPKVHTYGSDEGEALVQAVDAVETWLSYLIEEGEQIDEPSEAGNRRTISLPIRTTGKIAIYRAMMRQGLDEAALATHLKRPVRWVTSLLDLYADTDIEEIETALNSLGLMMKVKVEEAA